MVVASASLSGNAATPDDVIGKSITFGSISAPTHQTAAGHPVVDINKINPKRLFLDEYSFMAQPYSYYYFHHMDQLGFALDNVPAGRTNLPLKEPKGSFSITYTYNGEQRSLDEYLKRSDALGFLVLHGDEIVVERYLHGAGPSSRFLSQSIAKSILSTLVGIAINERKIASINDPVVKYLPELAQSGFKNVTVKHLLQMTSGVQFNENYLNPTAEIHQYVSALLTGTPTMKDLAASIKPKNPPGETFEYQSINSQVLSLLVESATKTPLNEYAAKKLWGPMGAERDAYYLRGPKQPSIPAAGGFAASLRDYGRFGLLFLNGGMQGDTVVVPEQWVKTAVSDEILAATPINTTTNDYYNTSGYAYNWWTFKDTDRAFAAEGIFGQAVYINRERQVVIVQSSAWPKPDEPKYWDEMITVMSAVAIQVSPTKDAKR